MRLNLNGEWNLRDECGKSLCKVTVPGTVIAAMYAKGLIQDPYYRENEDATRELFWHDYEFVRDFELDDEDIGHKDIKLICEGLDTLADIYINDTFVANTENMHRTYRLDINKFLRSGVNNIRIVFKSVLKYIEQYEYAPNKEIHCMPCSGILGNHLIRKPHSMFGWDWGPQTIDAGIWRDIYIEAVDYPQIEDVRIRQNHEISNIVKLEIDITMSETIAEKTADYVQVTLKDANGNVVDNVVAMYIDGIKYKAIIEVHEPELWWPNGYGRQPLYEVCVKALNADSVTKRIGLRTLTVSQEKDEWGSEFAFMVNGVKIFAMGGNYIPENAVYAWIKKENIEYLLKSCVRANYNCVRVWGGGYYPSDYFYDLCDEYGLIVWQDLMYACNVYDLTKDFAQNIIQETLDNVKRLRHHASLGLWCGNNEIETAWEHWEQFKEESVYLKADYTKMFEYILPNAVKEADDVTFYWPSSPSSGGCFDNPDDENRGDVHYWDVWHGQKPFSDYQKYYFRFCSEFGFQSFPSIKTVRTFTEESDRNIFSKVMERHQKNESANGKMLYYLSENFKYPKNFEKLLYITQILQGMAIKSGVEHWRRYRGRCMGAIYWQVNDNWPVASWASIDYYGRWKALHYMAARFFASVAASICRRDNTWSVHLENETMQVQAAKAVLRVKDMELNVVREWTVNESADALSAKKMIEIDMPTEYIGSTKHFVEMEVTLADGNVITDAEPLSPYKHMDLITPTIQTQVCEYESYYEIKLESDVYAPFVELDFRDADVIFSDNYFTITASEPRVIILKKDDIYKGEFKDADDLNKRLMITSVADSY